MSRSTVAIPILRTAEIACIPIVVSNSVQNGLSFTNRNTIVPEKAQANLFGILPDAGLGFEAMTPSRITAWKCPFRHTQRESILGS